MTKYRVSYIANDGTKCRFCFESNRKMVVTAGNRSVTGYDFGIPWMKDAKQAEAKFANDPNSKMFKHGGVKRWTAAENLNTKQHFNCSL